ncbi:MAG: cation transporter [Endozoicomonas sp.]
MINYTRVTSEFNDGQNVTAENDRLLKIATYASVATASILILAKLAAWFMTGSMSLMATLLDSTMDILASLITLFAVRIAITPPDEDHHFGHGKAEHLAVLAQSAFIAGSAIVLLLCATLRLRQLLERPRAARLREWQPMGGHIRARCLTALLVAGPL